MPHATSLPPVTTNDCAPGFTCSAHFISNADSEWHVLLNVMSLWLPCVVACISSLFLFVWCMYVVRHVNIWVLTPCTLTWDPDLGSHSILLPWDGLLSQSSPWLYSLDNKLLGPACLLQLAPGCQVHALPSMSYCCWSSDSGPPGYREVFFLSEPPPWPHVVSLCSTDGPIFIHLLTSRLDCFHVEASGANVTGNSGGGVFA